MLIESISITAYGDSIFYDVSCITGPVMGSWTRFFSNILARQNKQIMIGDSLLLVLSQVSEDLPLVESTDQHAYSPPYYIMLAAPYGIAHELLPLSEAQPAPDDKVTEWYKWG